MGDDMGTWFKFLVLSLSVAGATNVLAEDSESFTSYDSIVSELEASVNDVAPPERHDIKWDEVAMHGGMSGTMSYISVNTPAGETSGLLKGFEAHFGANLGSKKARAEIAFRNFIPEEFSGVTMNLNEYEGRLVFLPALRERTLLRMGLGLVGRDMEVDFQTAEVQGRRSEFTTASSMILGFEHRVSKAVSIGPDASYYTPLSSRTITKSAWDAAIRLNATF